MSNGLLGGSEGKIRRDMTLRQWLGRPGRVIDRVESLHIFRQVLEFVDLAHVQGVVLGNIRPSCFVLSPFNRVAFIDSASTPTSSDRSSERSTGRASVQALLRDSTFDLPPDDEASLDDPLEHSSSQRQVLASLDGETGPEWALLLESSGQHGHDSESQQDPVSVVVARDGIQADDYLVERACQSLITPPLGGSTSPSFVHEWSDCSGSELSADARARVAGVQPVQTASSGGRFSEDAGKGSGTEGSPTDYAGPPVDERFPQRHVLLMEQTWYASPEELVGGTGLFASDIYCLGVVFFELFCMFSSEAERGRVMSDLRHRILPPRMLSECPKEAAFCLWLLHPEPSSRPKAREVLRCELLSEAGEALTERQAAVSVEEKAAESDLLLDFLQCMQHHKQEAVYKLGLDVARLTSDIEEVERRRSVLKERDIPFRIPESGERFRNAGIKEDSYVRNHERNSNPGELEERNLLSLGKRVRDLDSGVLMESRGDGTRTLEVLNKRSSEISSKSARLMNNFSHLEKVYFSMRWKLGPQGLDSGRASSPNESHMGDSSYSGEVGCILKPTGQRSVHGSSNSDDWLGSFFDSLCKYARYSRFEVKATLRHGDLLNTANMVCSLSFDRDEEFFATAGVCKRIKVFECDSLLNENVDIHYPVVEMSSRSKVSSICWNSYIKSHIASSDYEGIVQLWDANTCKTLMEYQEHEKRAWSVDFSRADPTKLASGSDDGCVKLWSINTDSSIANIKTRANVCCVQFPPDVSHFLVFGSADYKIYCYDLRSTKAPLCVLAGHTKAVSYVKFVDSGTLVSASTDNTLKLWDLKRASSCHGVDSNCALTYMGHSNEKNFVGLSVADGYIACGSEKNAVFAYHKSLPMPMASHKFGSQDPISGHEIEDDGGQFVSSVCWRGKTQTLVAANSMGNIKVLEMV